MTSTMERRAQQNGGETVQLSEENEDASPGTIELRGIQDLSKLVHDGTVRLLASDGTVLELSDPTPIDDDLSLKPSHRVQLSVSFSNQMAESISERPELPDNAWIKFHWLPRYVEGRYGRPSEDYHDDEYLDPADSRFRVMVQPGWGRLTIDVDRIELLLPEDGAAKEETTRNIGRQAIG